MRWLAWVVVAAACELGACRDHGGSSSADDNAMPDAPSPDAGVHHIGACNSVQVTQDRDGDGVRALWRMGCGLPATPSWALGATDCDDTDPTRFELAWLDADGDGWSLGAGACVGPLPPGYTTQPLGEDCDDADKSLQMLAYVDADGDGFGAAKQCIPAQPNGAPPPKGLSRTAGDCDDQNAQSNPLALEQWHDGVDSNCDGLDDPLECDRQDASAGDTCGCQLLAAPAVAVDPACVGPSLFLAQQVTCSDCLERNIFVVGNRGTAAQQGGFDFTLGDDPKPLHVAGDLASGAVSLPVVVRAGGRSLHLVNSTRCAEDAGADLVLLTPEQCLTP